MVTSALRVFGLASCCALALLLGAVPRATGFSVTPGGTMGYGTVKVGRQHGSHHQMAHSAQHCGGSAGPCAAFQSTPNRPCQSGRSGWRFGPPSRRPTERGRATATCTCTCARQRRRALHRNPPCTRRSPRRPRPAGRAPTAAPRSPRAGAGAGGVAGQGDSAVLEAACLPPKTLPIR
jgi:hypothetical protein